MVSYLLEIALPLLRRYGIYVKSFRPREIKGGFNMFAALDRFFIRDERFENGIIEYR
jgi:hypothetical protein